MKKESLVAEFESAKMHLLAELKGYSNGLDIATYYPQAEKGQPIRVATFHQASQKVLIPSDLNAIHCADFVNEGDAFQEMIIQAEQGKFDMIITPSICKMYETKRLMRIINPLAYYEAFTEFCDILYTDITCRSLVPHDTFLVYDDEDIYHDALEYLERRKREGPTMKISLQERMRYMARLAKWVSTLSDPEEI